MAQQWVAPSYFTDMASASAAVHAVVIFDQDSVREELVSITAQVFLQSRVEQMQDRPGLLGANLESRHESRRGNGSDGSLQPIGVSLSSRLKTERQQVSS